MVLIRCLQYLRTFYLGFRLELFKAPVKNHAQYSMYPTWKNVFHIMTANLPSIKSSPRSSPAPAVGRGGEETARARAPGEVGGALYLPGEGEKKKTPEDHTVACTRQKEISIVWPGRVVI